MPIRPELLVRDPAGVPIPPSEITGRIHALYPSERFDLRYVSASWALIRYWAEDDRRRLWIREEQYDPAMAWDIIGFLPITCSVDEAPGFLERMLRMDSRDDIQRLALKIADWNVFDHQAEIVNEVVAATRNTMGKEDEIESAIYAVTAAPKAQHKKRGRKTRQTFVPKGTP